MRQAVREVDDAARRVGLFVSGGFRPEAGDGLPEGTGTVLMLSPDEPGFWPLFTASPEWGDGRADPIDRWSRRVVGGLAAAFGAEALYPFGGPPWHPFYAWALRTGRAFASPVTLLVHEARGLMISYRGALALPWAAPVPAPAASPCAACAGRPCLTACPPGALGATGYDVPACHRFLDAGNGDCMNGCLVRRACPVGQGLRSEAQSAFHMERFHRAGGRSD